MQDLPRGLRAQHQELPWGSDAGQSFTAHIPHLRDGRVVLSDHESDNESCGEQK